jgi:hypothetical protein
MASTAAPIESQQTIADPETWVASMPEAYLLCRDFGHAWHVAKRRTVYDEMTRSWTRVVTCTRCKTVRSQEYDSVGYLVSRTYDRSACPDYVAPAGIGMLGRDLRGYLRLESMQRDTAK